MDHETDALNYALEMLRDSINGYKFEYISQFKLSELGFKDIILMPKGNHYYDYKATLSGKRCLISCKLTKTKLSKKVLMAISKLMDKDTAFYILSKSGIEEIKNFPNILKDNPYDKIKEGYFKTSNGDMIVINRYINTS